MTAELISFGLGANWVGKLWSTLRSIQKMGKQELGSENVLSGGPIASDNEFPQYLPSLCLTGKRWRWFFLISILMLDSDLSLRCKILAMHCQILLSGEACFVR